jgi:chemotaxis signal transduction protein
LAFEFGWARSIVERFELTAVPRAPEWLAGACNIDGELVSVVDLSRFISPNQPPLVISKAHRLLVAGVGAESIGFLFTQRPQMLRFTPGQTEGMRYLPERVRAFARGFANNAAAEQFIDIDPERLMAQLTEALAV